MKELKEEEHKKLSALAEKVRGLKVTVHPIFKEGVPFLEILKTAEETPADLIVLGTHGRTGLAHVLLGSVAERVVRQATCPVMTIRPKTQKKPAEGAGALKERRRAREKNPFRFHERSLNSRPFCPRRFQESPLLILASALWQVVLMEKIRLRKMSGIAFPGPWVAVVAFLFSSLLGSPVRAEVYQWEDEQGVMHLTDDLGKVPEKYYDRTREITLPASRALPEAGEPSPSAPEPTLPRFGEQYDYNGRDRNWWLEQANVWRAKKTGAEERWASAQQELSDLPSNLFFPDLVQKRAEIEKRMAAYQDEIREADRMLNDVLPEEARKAGALPGWLRD